jgi:WD40 repeat protein
LPEVPKHWSAEKFKLEGHESAVRAVAISEDGKLVASGSGDSKIRLWSTATGEQTLKLEGHEEWVEAVAISTDGKTVASCSGDKTVRLWSIATGEQTLKLEGHEDGVLDVAISTDGKTVASGSMDKSVRLWSTVTGEQTLKLEGHEDRVLDVAISTDCKTVASSSTDSTIRLWSMATGEQIRCFETQGCLNRIRYTDDSSALETDRGLLDLNLPSGYGPALLSPPETLVVLDSPWVKYKGSDLLWLPHEYRGCHSATHNAFLVIGQASGAMSFFSFKPWDSVQIMDPGSQGPCSTSNTSG